MNEKALHFLGLLNKGGSLIFGPALLHSHRLSVLIIAIDASPTSQKELHSLANKTKAKILAGVRQEELGSALGYPKLSGIGVKDPKAGKALIAKWGE